MRATAIALTALVLAGCGSGGDDELTLSAASSLKTAMTNYTFEDATVRASFAGSDELAAQIRQGVKPDVYAAANMELPNELYEEGLLEEPLTFAFNQLVIAVPDGSEITAVGALAIWCAELRAPSPCQ